MKKIKTPKTTEATPDNGGSSTKEKYKSYKWLSPLRWKLHSSSRSNTGSGSKDSKHGLSPFQEQNLQDDLDELAAVVLTAGSTSITEFSRSVSLLKPEDLERLTAGEQPWLRMGSLNLNLNYDTEMEMVNHHPDNSCQQYVLKRLPASSAAASVKSSSSKPNKKRLATAALVREALLLSKLGEHPNVLSLRGLPSTVEALAENVQSNSFCFLTDPLHRETLDTRIRTWRGETVAAKVQAEANAFLPASSRRHIPSEDLIPRKISYAYQLAKALQACHDAGILVRDISPHKVGFCPDDPHVVQLFDLGNAMPMRTAAVSSGTGIVGKRRYMAGEIWRTGDYSTATDIYAWSMIFYEMLAEAKPFLDLTALEHQRLVCVPQTQEESARPPLLEYCFPDEVEELLQKAWNVTPSKRPSTDQLCRKMQSLVLHVDDCLLQYDADIDESDCLSSSSPLLDPDHDFLLDVHVVRYVDDQGDFDDDAISAIGDSVPDKVAEDDAMWSFLEDSVVNLTLADSDDFSVDNGNRVSTLTGTSSGSSCSSIATKDNTANSSKVVPTPPQQKKPFKIVSRAA